MRRMVCAAALLGVLALLAAAVQAPARCTGVPAKKPYCSKCDKTLDPKTEMKGKKCIKDETDTTMVDVCVKSTPYVKCHPSKEGLKVGGTWWGNTITAQVDEARVVSKCQACTVESAVAKDLKHADDCKKKTVLRACKHVQ